MNGAAPLTVEPVERPAENDAFIRLPWAIYRDDPAWVPPLLLERREHLDPRKNPFFETAEARFWLARRGGRPVGRISAQLNRAYLARHQDDTGHFGMLEAEDDAEVFQALFSTAEDWLKGQGLRRALGPFNLSINEDCGLLVDGFQHPPSMLMGHARPYYAKRVEENGYRKEKDLLAYIIDADFAHPRAMQAITARAKKRVHIRSLRKSDFKNEQRSNP